MNRTQSSPLSSSRSRANAPPFAGRTPQAYIWILVACGVVLSVCFVRAAAQHIAAVNHGYECEKLRGEQAALLAEQKRLQLAYNEATAPRNLESMARQHGLNTARASQLRNTFDAHSGEAKQVAVKGDFAKQVAVKQVSVKQDAVKLKSIPDAPASSTSVTSNLRRAAATGR
ncbi:MAG: hypothetical protein MSG64_07120 [Pyrinomonadaceae bacterium MAG19_C2-C3]|nr:hypothetical protein [Pyrinomonadaceae bacterium MAG19_C2-C3]